MINEENYLINNLKQGRYLNVVLLSHNAYWPVIQKLQNKFERFNLQIFGGSTSYIKSKINDTSRQIDDCDLIIFYSSNFYDEKEMNELKSIASKISEEKEKRVTIGYYATPKPPVIDLPNVKIISFNNNQEKTENLYLDEYSGLYDLVEITLIKHDNYNLGKNIELIKKSN